MPLIAAGIMVAGSIASSLIAKSGAKSAANTAATADSTVGNAINNATQGGVSAISALTGQGQAGVASATQGGQSTITAGQSAANTQLGNVYLSQLANTQPYQEAGAQGVTALQAATAPGGALAGTFQAPTEAEVENTPGYQFQLKQGTQAIEQSQAANGLLQSGGTLKGLEQYGQGLASTTYQQAYNNALTGYQTNFNNTFNSLSSLAGIGLSSTAQANQAAQNYGNLFSSNTMTGSAEAANLGLQGAENISATGLSGATAASQLGVQGTVEAGNAFMGAGNAAAAGQAGQANAVAQGVNGVAQAAGGYFSSLAQPTQSQPIPNYNLPTSAGPVPFAHLIPGGYGSFGSYGSSNPYDSGDDGQ